MTEPEVTAEAQTAPSLPVAEEAQSAEPETTQETSPLTRDEVAAIIEEKVAARALEIEKQLDSAYKALRRGEAKGDMSLKELQKIRAEIDELSLRGLEPEKAELVKLQRQVQRDAESRNAPVDSNAELAQFNAYAKSVLEEEGIAGTDPVLTEWFKKYGEGYQTQADLRVALTRAIAKVRTEEAKKAKADSADREKKAREEERAKLRNEKRQEEGKVDRGTPAAGQSKNFLTMSSEELEAFEKSRRR